MRLKTTGYSLIGANPLEFGSFNQQLLSIGINDFWTVEIAFVRVVFEVECAGNLFVCGQDISVRREDEFCLEGD